MSGDTRFDSRPRLEKVSRRKFLKVIALGGGTAALTAAGISVIPSLRSLSSPSPDDVPVRNPGFLAIPGEMEGHVVLCCQSGENDYLTYDLNPSGYLIWQKCTGHLEFAKGIRKSLSQITDEVVEHFDARTVKDFVGLIYAKGLAYSGSRQSKAYFVYEERH